MWKKLQDSPPFYLQFSQTNTYEISITDYITLYEVNLTKKDFILILKESNRKLEITDEELIDNAKSMLLNMENLKDLSISKQDSHLELYICKIHGYPFKLRLSLPEATKEIFFQKVTQPLLRTVKELQSIEQNLRESLKKKDEEIDKYNMKGFKIEKYRRTTVFNEEEHLKKHEVFQGDGMILQDFPTSLLEKKVIKGNVIQVKQEKTGINEIPLKQEPITLEEQNQLLTNPKTEIKEEIKNEPQNSNNLMKKRKMKLNL